LTSLARGTVYILIAEFMFFASSYIISVGLAHLLSGPAEFGVYGVVISLITLVSIALTVPFQQAVAKFISERGKFARLVTAEALKVQAVLSVSLFIVYYLSAEFFAGMLNDPTLTPYIRLSSFVILFHPVYAVFKGYFNGLKAFGGQAALSVFYTTVKILLILGLVIGGFGLAGAIGGFAAAPMLAALLGFFLIRPKRETGEFDRKRFISFTASLMAFTVISHLLLTIDLFAVKALTPPDISSTLAGYYTVATTLAKIPHLVIFALSFVLLPLVSGSTFNRLEERTSFYIRNAMRYSLLIIVPVAFLFSSTSVELISLLFSAKYAAGSAALELLVFGFSFLALSAILTTTISGSGRPNTSLAIYAISLVIALALNIVLVPVYGMIGAATASTIAMFAGFAIAAAYVYIRFNALVSKLSAVRIILAGIVIYFLSGLFAWEGLMLLPKYVILFAAFVGLLYASGELKQADFNRVLAAIR